MPSSTSSKSPPFAVPFARSSAPGLVRLERGQGARAHRGSLGGLGPGLSPASPRPRRVEDTASFEASPSKCCRSRRPVRPIAEIALSHRTARRRSGGVRPIAQERLERARQPYLAIAEFPERRLERLGRPSFAASVRRRSASNSWRATRHPWRPPRPGSPAADPQRPRDHGRPVLRGTLGERRREGRVREDELLTTIRSPSISTDGRSGTTASGKETIRASMSGSSTPVVTPWLSRRSKRGRSGAVRMG